MTRPGRRNLTSRLTTLAAVLLAFSTPAPLPAAAPVAQQTESQIKAEKLKTLYRRQPRAQDFVARVEHKLAAGKSGADPVLTSRLQEAFNTVVMNADSLSEERLHDAVEFLKSMGEPIVELSQEDLTALKARYKKICASIDDQIFIKDLESVLKLHDRFVRHTSLGLWNKAQIEAQLKRMEDVLSVAPDIAYGRSELLRNRQDQRLAAASNGCYFGAFPHEEIFLSPDRFSVGVLEESTGGSLVLDNADMIIQAPDGRLIDLNEPNHPIHGMPFSPPLSLWVKSRLLEGRVPAVTFRLVDKSIEECYGGSERKAAPPVLAVADVLAGNLDDYFKRNLTLLAETKQPTVVAFLTDFDRAPAATAFGADGRTPYYFLVDPKLAKLPDDKRDSEIQKRLEKGTLTKDSGEELRKHYGDPAIPDGPERVRDCWKRLRQLASEAGCKSISLMAASGPFHGNKKALSQPGGSQAGAQDWNKLEFYWPGDGVLDWVGVNAVCSGTAAGSQEAPLANAIEQFMVEKRNSDWRATPVLLMRLAPGPGRNPPAEATWLVDTFATVITSAYPDVKAFYIDYPGSVTLWSADARSAFRRNVSSSPYYKQKLLLKPAPQQ